MNTFSDTTKLREKIQRGAGEPQDYIDLADALYTKGEFDECLSTLRAAEARAFAEPSKARVLNVLGVYVMGIAGDDKEAAVLAERASRLLDECETADCLIQRANSMALLAVSLWDTDNARSRDAGQLALSLFDRLLTNMGATLEKEALCDVHWRCAHIHCLWQETSVAEHHCTLALDFAETSEQKFRCLTELGTVYRMAKRHAEARSQFRQAVGRQDVPEHDLVPAFYELGLTEWELGKLPEARAKLQRARTILANHPRLSQRELPHILHAIVEISYELGDYEEASATSTELLAHYSIDNRLYWLSLQWLAQCQWQLGQLEGARRSFERIVESPLIPLESRTRSISALLDLKLEIASLHYNEGKFAACIRDSETLLQQLEDNDGRSSAVLLLLAHSYASIEKNVVARKYYEQISLSPSAPAEDRQMAERCLRALERMS